MIRASLAGLAVGALPLLLSSAAALAQDEDAPFDRTPRKCIRVTSIDQTEAVDDQNILFYMRGSDVYRNHLPRNCPRLERENRIAYRVYSGQLCDHDTITVLEDSVSGLQGGFTCSLGEFVPLSPEEIEDLKRDEDLPGGPAPVEAEAIDLPRSAQPGAEADSEPVETPPVAEPND
jgi:hypothetical protein